MYQNLVTSLIASVLSNLQSKYFNLRNANFLIPQAHSINIVLFMILISLFTAYLIIAANLSNNIVTTLTVGSGRSATFLSYPTVTTENLWIESVVLSTVGHFTFVGNL